MGILPPVRRLVFNTVRLPTTSTDIQTCPRSTTSSQAVAHSNTSLAQCALTSMYKWELLHSTLEGSWLIYKSWFYQREHSALISTYAHSQISSHQLWEMVPFMLLQRACHQNWWFGSKLVIFPSHWLVLKWSAHNDIRKWHHILKSSNIHHFFTPEENLEHFLRGKKCRKKLEKRFFKSRQRKAWCEGILEIFNDSLL